MLAVSAAAAFVIWQYWYRPEVEDITKFIPADASVVIAQSDNSKNSENINLITVNADWQKKLSELERLLAVKFEQIIWTWSEESNSPTLLIQTNQSVAKKIRLQMQNDNKQVKFLTANIFTVSNNNLFSAGTNFVSTVNWPKSGQLVAWSGNYPTQQAEEFSFAFTPANSGQAEENIVISEPWKESSRIVWQEKDQSFHLPSQSATLYFPQNFSTYALLSKQTLQQIQQGQMGQYSELISQGRKLIAQYLGLNIESLIKSVDDYALVAWNNSDWLFSSNQQAVDSVLQAVAGLSQPKIKKSRLPDGSIYRELIRSQEQGQIMNINGKQVSYWGSAAENRIYLLNSTGTKALGPLVTNQLSMLESAGADNSPLIPQVLLSCLNNQSGTVVNLIWTGQINTAKGQNIIFVELADEGKRSYIFCYY